MRDRRYMVQYAIENHMGWKDYQVEIMRMYSANMSSHEIADVINSGLDKPLITPRSIQRRLAKVGMTRSVGDAFRLAMSKDRVQWAYKLNKAKPRSRLATKLRYEILRRDGFRCVLCGATAEMGLLEADHIIQRAQGGVTEMSNMRTLCYDCNAGRQHSERAEGIN